MHASSLPHYSLLRMASTLKSAHVYHKDMMPYVATLHPLERLAFCETSKEMLDALRLHQPLSALELLVANRTHSELKAETQSVLHAQYPELTFEHIDQLTSPKGYQWYYSPDHFQYVSPQARELVELFAGWTNQLARGIPGYMDTFEKQPHLVAHPWLQQMWAVRYFDLFEAMFDTYKDQGLMDSTALGLSHFNRPDRGNMLFKYMNAETFREILTPSYDLYRYTGPKNLKFPKAYLPIVYERHPALYVRGVILNDDMRNGQSLVQTWFKPALLATFKRSVTNPDYLSTLIVMNEPKGRRYFNKVMAMYAPEEFQLLEVCKTLYGDKPSDLPHVYNAWAKTVVDRDALAGVEPVDLNALMEMSDF